MAPTTRANGTDRGLDAVADALAHLGHATAAAIGTKANVPYSTTNKKLRLLEDAGVAEAFKAGDGRTQWRLTNTDAAAPDPDADADADATNDKAGTGPTGTDPDVHGPDETDLEGAVAGRTDGGRTDGGEPDTGRPDRVDADPVPGAPTDATASRSGPSEPSLVEAEPDADRPVSAPAGAHGAAEAEQETADNATPPDPDRIPDPDPDPDRHPDGGVDAGGRPPQAGAQTGDDAAVNHDGRVTDEPAGCGADLGPGHDPTDPTGPGGTAHPDAPPAADATDATDPPQAVPVPAPDPASAPTPITPPAGQPAADADPQPATPTPAPPRRRKGDLQAEVLLVLQAEPGRPFKVGEVCSRVDAAAAGTGLPKASQGAVANALDTLTATGGAQRVVDLPATFQAVAESSPDETSTNAGPDRAVPNGAVPNGVVPNGAVPDGAGAVHQPEPSAASPTVPG